MQISEYESIMQDSGAYKDIEIEILKETLVSCDKQPEYSLIELRDGLVLAGFSLIHRAAATNYTWDINVFCIGQNYRHTPVAKELLDMLVSKIMDSFDTAVLKIETSTQKENAIAEKFFISSGFTTIGHIPSFYSNDDDYYIHIMPLINPNFSSI